MPVSTDRVASCSVVVQYNSVNVCVYKSSGVLCQTAFNHRSCWPLNHSTRGDRPEPATWVLAVWQVHHGGVGSFRGSIAAIRERECVCRFFRETNAYVLGSKHGACNNCNSYSTRMQAWILLLDLSRAEPRHLTCMLPGWYGTQWWNSQPRVGRVHVLSIIRHGGRWLLQWRQCGRISANE